jgi:hypothetical protein
MQECKGAICAAPAGKDREIKNHDDDFDHHCYHCIIMASPIIPGVLYDYFSL